MSTTYPVPGSEGDYPAARFPDLRLRLVPNETLLPQLGNHLGELVQELLDEGQELGISVEIDTSDRTRPGELRGGASPAMTIALAVLSGSVGAVANRCFDAVIRWARKHHHPDAPVDDPLMVVLYGPEGEILREVQVERGDPTDRD